MLIEINIPGILKQNSLQQVAEKKKVIKYQEKNLLKYKENVLICDGMKTTVTF